MIIEPFIERASTLRLNLDISNKCPLECLRCARRKFTKNNNTNGKIPGRNLSIKEFDTITNFFPKISFCGQYSDPIHHPYFIDFLIICKEKRIYTSVHTASSFKSKEWYIKAFNTHPHADWMFGIDGLPNQSHIYRKNQDGEKLFDIMLEAKKYLVKPPIWQYILFKYNQDNVNEAMQLASDHNLRFDLLQSNRLNDFLRPDKLPEILN